MTFGRYIAAILKPGLVSPSSGFCSLLPGWRELPPALHISGSKAFLEMLKAIGRDVSAADRDFRVAFHGIAAGRAALSFIPDRWRCGVRRHQP